MPRTWKPGELETVRALHSPIFTESTIEGIWNNLSDLKPRAKNTVIIAQSHCVEGFMEAVRCLLAGGIKTLDERDKYLEKLWASVEDAPIDPDTECLEEEALGFPPGTHREELWRWFDERYSKGVAHLLYGYDGVDRTDLIARLVYLNGLCDECDSETCAYNEDGVCKYPLVHGRKPQFTERDGCVDGAFAEGPEGFQ